VIFIAFLGIPNGLSSPQFRRFDWPFQNIHWRLSDDCIVFKSPIQFVSKGMENEVHYQLDDVLKHFLVALSTIEFDDVGKMATAI
jgi:hypothetical protein